MKFRRKFGMTRKELLSLPECKFTEQETRRYASLLIVPARKLHDSGFRLMAIIGIGDDGKPIEIADFCDDIEWITPTVRYSSGLEYSPLRTDMFPDINCIRAWTNCGYFTVKGCSSATIKLVINKK